MLDLNRRLLLPEDTYITRLIGICHQDRNAVNGNFQLGISLLKETRAYRF